jgi:predicted Rossmann fold nucleotide-binding protein DprA/Smf involved in DNA uptake
LGRAALRSHPNAHKPQRIDTAAGEAEALGDQSLVGRRKLALICSQKCPGNVILKTYDFARLVRDYSGTAIVSGFHSPIEKDCLPILLRGPSFVIIVQAHRLGTSRLPRDWQRAIDTGRLLLPSPFTEKHKRVTAALAAERNRFVAAISDEVLIPYAAPSSKTEALALDLLKSGKRVYTFTGRPGTLLAQPVACGKPPALKPALFSELLDPANGGVGRII